MKNKAGYVLGIVMIVCGMFLCSCKHLERKNYSKESKVSKSTQICSSKWEKLREFLPIGTTITYNLEKSGAKIGTYTVEITKNETSVISSKVVANTTPANIDQAPVDDSGASLFVNTNLIKDKYVDTCKVSRWDVIDRTQKDLNAKDGSVTFKDKKYKTVQYTALINAYDNRYELISENLFLIMVEYRTNDTVFTVKEIN